MAANVNLPISVAFSFDDPEYCRQGWDMAAGALLSPVVTAVEETGVDTDNFEQVVFVLEEFLEDDTFAEHANDIQNAISMLRGSCESRCDCADMEYQIEGIDAFSAFLGALPSTIWATRTAGPSRPGRSSLVQDDVEHPLDVSEIYDVLRWRSRWRSAELIWDGTQLEAVFETGDNRADLTLTPIPVEHLVAFLSWREGHGEYGDPASDYLQLDLPLMKVLHLYQVNIAALEPSRLEASVPSLEYLRETFEWTFDGCSLVVSEVARGLLPNWAGDIPELFESAELLAKTRA